MVDKYENAGKKSADFISDRVTDRIIRRNSHRSNNLLYGVAVECKRTCVV